MGKKGAKHTHTYRIRAIDGQGRLDPVERCGEVARDEIRELEK